MFTISTGFTYIAFLMFIAGTVLALEKYTNWKGFNVIPPLVWIYGLNMIFCTIGLFDDPACAAANLALKNDLVYAMIFVVMLRCGLRRFSKLGGRLIAIFLACSITLGIGTVLGYPIFMNALGGGEQTWAAVAALYASWVGGSANMAAMIGPLPVDSGAYACALALDTVCYAVWVALLLLGVRRTQKWNNAVKADTSMLEQRAEITNVEASKRKKRPTATDWSFLLGLSLMASALSQELGKLAADNLGLLSQGVWTTLILSVAGLLCASTPLGQLPAIEELGSVYLYGIISLMGAATSILPLMDAPMWVVYGFVILAIHAVLMFLLSKVFHWDLAMVSIASIANVGGAASAPIVANAHNPSYAGIGVLMGVLGAALANFFALGMGGILQMFI